MSRNARFQKLDSDVRRRHVSCLVSRMPKKTGVHYNDTGKEKEGIAIIVDFTASESIVRDTRVAIAELKYAAMFARFFLLIRISKLMASHLTDIDNSAIFKSLKVGPIKVRDLIVHVLSKTRKEALVNILQKANFSIYLDESTDSLVRMQCHPISTRFRDRFGD